MISAKVIQQGRQSSLYVFRHYTGRHVLRISAPVITTTMTVQFYSRVVASLKGVRMTQPLLNVQINNVMKNHTHRTIPQLAIHATYHYGFKSTISTNHTQDVTRRVFMSPYNRRPNDNLRHARIKHERSVPHHFIMRGTKRTTRTTCFGTKRVLGNIGDLFRLYRHGSTMLTKVRRVIFSRSPRRRLLVRTRFYTSPTSLPHFFRQMSNSSLQFYQRSLFRNYAESLRRVTRVSSKSVIFCRHRYLTRVRARYTSVSRLYRYLNSRQITTSLLRRGGILCTIYVTHLLSPTYIFRGHIVVRRVDIQRGRAYLLPFGTRARRELITLRSKLWGRETSLLFF